ncbi:MAG: M56 family metallopeptidase [Planctomycetota bacterium]
MHLLLETLLALCAGIALATLGAEVMQRLSRRATVHRFAWHAALIGVAALLLLELSGTGAYLTERFFREEPVIAAQPRVVSKGEPPIVETTDPVTPSAVHLRTRLLSNSIQPIVRPVSAGNDDDSNESRTEQAPEQKTKDSASAPLWMPWIALTWAIGTLGSLLWITTRRVRAIVWAERSKELVTPDLESEIRETARSLPVRVTFRVRALPKLQSPATSGWLRPTLWLPRSFAADYAPEERQAILLHELAHIRGRDPLFRDLADALRALLWWNPLVWWMHRRAHTATENAADAACLVMLDGPSVLARCLVRLGRQVKGPALVLGARIVGPGFRSALGRRVVKLLELESIGSGRWQAPAWLRTIVLSTICLVTFLGSGATRTGLEKEPPMQSWSTSWRQSVAGWLITAAVLPGSSAQDSAPVRTERTESLKALGYLGEKESKAEALRALGYLGEPTGGPNRAALTEALRGLGYLGAPDEELSSLRALGYVGQQEEAAKGQVAEDPALVDALRRLGYVGRDEAARDDKLEALVKRLGYQSPEAIQEAVKAIRRAQERLNDPESKSDSKVLLELLESLGEVRETQGGEQALEGVRDITDQANAGLGTIGKLLGNSERSERFVFTRQSDKEHLKALIESAGGEVHDQVDRETDYLVLGDPALGSGKERVDWAEKYQCAMRFGVQILSPVDVIENLKRRQQVDAKLAFLLNAVSGTVQDAIEAEPINQSLARLQSEHPSSHILDVRDLLTFDHADQVLEELIVENVTGLEDGDVSIEDGWMIVDASAEERREVGHLIEDLRGFFAGKVAARASGQDAQQPRERAVVQIHDVRDLYEDREELKQLAGFLSFLLAEECPEPGTSCDVSAGQILLAAPPRFQELAASLLTKLRQTRLLSVEEYRQAVQERRGDDYRQKLTEAFRKWESQPEVTSRLEVPGKRTTRRVLLTIDLYTRPQKAGDDIELEILDVNEYARTEFGAGPDHQQVIAVVEEGQKLQVNHLAQVPYISRFDLEVTKDQVIADPVVETVPDGFVLSLVPEHIGKDSVRFGIELDIHDLRGLDEQDVSPIEGGAPMTIQIPNRVEDHHASTLETTAAFRVIPPYKQSVVLVRVIPLEDDGTIVINTKR